MLSMKVVDYVESTNEEFYHYYCSETDIVCWGRTKGRSGVIKSFNDNCVIGRKLVRETEGNQEKLDYWLSHLDKWNEYHRASIEAGDMKENDIKKELDYFIKKVQLFEDDKVIKEEIFRYGR